MVIFSKAGQPEAFPDRALRALLAVRFLLVGRDGHLR